MCTQSRIHDQIDHWLCSAIGQVSWLGFEVGRGFQAVVGHRGGTMLFGEVESLSRIPHWVQL